MERDDAIKNLRADLIRLETELAAAKKRLEALEQVPTPAVVAPVEPVVPVVTDEAPPVSTSVSIPSPVPPVAPPPLPWERPAATPPPIPAFVGAAKAEPAPEEMFPAPKPKPSPWAEPAPKKPRRFGPPEGLDFETALTTWWFPRIGITALSISVVMLLTILGNAIKASWMWPYLQVAGGYVVCAALLLAAKSLEDSARNYARVLASGGFALSYFTTFAAHFVVRPPVIASQTLTGLLLLAVVLAWGTVAQRRRSPLLGLGVTLLGHLTIFLSLKAADTGGAFSTATLLLFSLMSAFFLVKNRWYSVGAAGMICSYLNLAVLLDNQVFVSHAMGTASAVALLAVVYAVFALAELFAPEELRRRDLRLSMRSAYVAANTFCALGLAWLLWNDTGGPLPGIHVLFGGAGLVVLVIARTYYHARQGDPLYNIYQIKGLSLLTLAFGKYLSGEQFAVTLAVESLLLLLNASVTGFVVSRVFSILCAGMSAGVMTLALLRLGLQVAEPEHRGAEYAMWIVLAVLQIAGVVYLRVDWRTRGLAAASVPLWCRDWFREADLLDESNAKGLLKVGKRNESPWPLLYASAALVPWAIWLLHCGAGGNHWRGEALAAGALLLLSVAGAALRAWSITWPLIAAAPLLLVAIYFPGGAVGPRWLVARPLEVGFVALAMLVLADVARVTRGRAEVLWPALFLKPRGSAHWFALLAAAPLFSFVGEYAQPADVALYCALIALAFALYTAATNAVFWQTVVIFQAIAAFGGIVRTFDMGTAWDGGQIPLLIAMAIPAFIGQPQWLAGRAGVVRFRQFPIALWLAGAFWSVLFVAAWNLPDPWPLYAFPAIAGFGLVLAFAFDARVFSLLALLSIAGAMAACVLDPSLPRDFQWKLAMLTLIALSFATERTMRARGVWLGARLHDFAISGALLASLLLVFIVVQGPLEDTLAFTVGAAFLLYAGRGNLYITGALGGVLAIVATILAVQGQLGELDRYPLLGPIATTGAALAFWAVVEWGLRTRGTSDNQRGIANLLALLVCGLLLCMLNQIDALASFYLTIAWTLAAVAMMLAGASSGQAFYRYGGLATFGIVTLRAALWDTRHLELISRTISWMLLGVVLLVVAYGYIRARGKKG